MESELEIDYHDGAGGVYVPLEEEEEEVAVDENAGEGVVRVERAKHVNKVTRRFVMAGFVLLCFFLTLIVVTVSTLDRQKNDSGASASPSPSSSVPAPVPHPSAERFAEKIRVEHMRGHLKALESIGPSRSMETGHKASAAYVMRVLSAYPSALQIDVHPFFVNCSRERSPTFFSLSPGGALRQGIDFDVLSAPGQVNVSGSGSVVVHVGGDGLGCSRGDFASASASASAFVLVRRGNCTFATKADGAAKAGYAGVVIYNDGVSMDRLLSFRGFVDGQTIPVLSCSFALGRSHFPGQRAVLRLDHEQYRYETCNVLATTKSGDASNTVVVGTHLDSVPAGPGINDNGSGVAFNLELALAVARTPFLNRVVFAFWGAEELGLLGSEAWVASRTPSQLRELVASLDLDMLASPNYHFGLYDACSLDSASGSCAVQRAFEFRFAERKIVPTLGAFDGRSDYVAFLQRNISSGGVYAGAEKIKSAQLRSKVGGLAGAAFDPCYHQACDTLDNINEEVYGILTQISAEVLETLASTPNLGATLGSA